MTKLELTIPDSTGEMIIEIPQDGTPVKILSQKDKIQEKVEAGDFEELIRLWIDGYVDRNIKPNKFET